MDPLPCNLAAMFLYRNPGHCFSRSAVKIAADYFFGVLALLRLYIWPKGSTKKIFFLFARVPPSKLLGKAKRAGYCSPSVAQIGVFIRECDKRLLPCEGQPQDVPQNGN